MPKLFSMTIALAMFSLIALWAHQSESLSLTIFGLTYAGFALVEILLHLKQSWPVALMFFFGAAVWMYAYTINSPLFAFLGMGGIGMGLAEITVSSLRKSQRFGKFVDKNHEPR